MVLPMHRLDVPDPVTMPFAVGTFDSIGPLSRADFPHRHTFYEIAFVTRGQGRHVVDLAEHPIGPPDLFVIAPGQVHHWEVSGLDGHVILFTEDFLGAYPADRELLHAMSQRRVPLERGAAQDVRQTVGQLGREFSGLAAGSLGVLQAFVHIMLVRVWRTLGGAPAVAGASRAAQVTAEFTRMLAAPGGPRGSARTYASRLGISPGYLAEASRETVGRTPAQLIRRAQVLEASRLLAGTRLTVAQVAAQVGFTDPAYFSRFFRRETGMTPGSYRRAVR